MAEDFLDECTRAEDIILGALGFDADVKILSIKKSKEGFVGIAVDSVGEQFEIKNEFPLEELDVWALNILIQRLKNE